MWKITSACHVGFSISVSLDVSSHGVRSFSSVIIDSKVEKCVVVPISATFFLLFCSWLMVKWISHWAFFLQHLKTDVADLLCWNMSGRLRWLLLKCLCFRNFCWQVSLKQFSTIMNMYVIWTLCGTYMPRLYSWWKPGFLDTLTTQSKHNFWHLIVLGTHCLNTSALFCDFHKR